ncbi:MAG TPA: hypothetical protein DCS93_42185 [Microscillaceae bacterium]|nr:hypothetical protein [Microscillaceae bacterium]
MDFKHLILITTMILCLFLSSWSFKYDSYRFVIYFKPNETNFTRKDSTRLDTVNMFLDEVIKTPPKDLKNFKVILTSFGCRDEVIKNRNINVIRAGNILDYLNKDVDRRNLYYIEDKGIKNYPSLDSCVGGVFIHLRQFE